MPALQATVKRGDASFIPRWSSARRACPWSAIRCNRRYGTFRYAVPRPSIEKADSAPGSKEVDCRFNLVDAGYFSTLGIPLLRGRTFRAGEPAAIIDEGAAAAFGRRETRSGMVRVIAGESKRDLEIVGVVSNIQDGIIGRDNTEPHVYIPFGQEYLSDITIHLRTAPGILPATVRAAIRDVDPALPVVQLRSFRQHLESGFDLWTIRTGARLFTIFGAVALLLAAVGVLPCGRTTSVAGPGEMGIRMALGASAPEICGWWCVKAWPSPAWDWVWA